MLARQAVRQVTQLSRTASIPPLRASFSTTQCIRATAAGPELDDPGMNGGYINPPAIKRQHRDPYGDYTDKQERRNFGEPMHEDEDNLQIFSLEEYTAMKPKRGALLWGLFVGCVSALSYAVYITYPDRPSAPKEYPGGLEEELGGSGALRAHKAGDEVLGVKL